MAVFVLASIQGPVFGQVSAEVLNNGQTALTVQPGPVSLKLDIRLSCSLPDIAAVQFALVCSDGTAFAYASPPVVTGAPWGPDDLILPAEINVGDLLSTKPDIIFIRLSGADPTSADFPATIVSYNIQSVADLPAGATYVFSLGGAGLPPVWARALPDGSVDSGDIENAAVFTLTVAGSGGGGGGGGGVVGTSVSAVQVQSGSALDITFSGAMGTGATAPGNYTLSGNGRGTLAAQPDNVALVSGNTYRLTWTTGEMRNGGDITVTVANVLDSTGAAIGSPNTATHAGGGIGISPAVSGVQVQTASTIDVTFSEPMGTGATLAANYTVSGTGKGTLTDNPAEVALLSGSTYRLTWTSGEMVGGGDITVAVTLAQDLAGNTITKPNSGTHIGGGLAPASNGGSDQNGGDNNGGTDQNGGSGNTNDQPPAPPPPAFCGAGLTSELMLATIAGLALLPRRRRPFAGPCDRSE